MTIYKTLYFLLAIALLWGCAPDSSTELPDERPFGTVNGNAVDGLITGAQVSIYSLKNGIRGLKLGETTTDATGAYSVDIQSPNQPILIEVSGGSYIEEATGTPVLLKDGQTLVAVGMYKSGQTHHFMVTPLTHLVTGLAEYKTAMGMSVENAIEEARITVNQFFSLDVVDIIPIDITDENSGVSVFGDDVLYGFYLAGLSDWTLWASNENQENQPHTIYNSIALSQIFYHDLLSDGLLDGIGFNQAGTELEPLGFGIVPLNADTYRLIFSLHMLAIANSAENKTSFVANDLLDAANSIAAQTTLLVGASNPVDIDNQAPTFNNTGTHSQARFSNSDGSYTEAALQDINDSVPLYFETDNVDIGSVLISRATLDSNAIPYFAFGVSDEMGPGLSTDPQDITVRVQYRRNNLVLNPWRTLAPVNDEYMIPLAAETLSADWHQSTPSDEHLIEVEVTDIVGNQTIRNFSFRADFYVPVLTIDTSNITDLGADIFSTTAFIDRDNLNAMQFASTAYSFTNTTGKSFYMNLSDSSAHTTTQAVEQLVREHLVNIKTTTEWRLGLMTPTDNCPEMTSWTTTSSVWNWNGSGWVEEQAPLPNFGAEENIFEDALPTNPTPSVWSDVSDFDQTFWIENITNIFNFWTYGYDYILDPNDLTPTAASIAVWSLRDRNTGITTECDSKHYFQQREVYSYESVSGYPAPVLSTVTLSNTPDFSTISYAVMDNDTGLEIVPVNNWYQIPVGHSITIQKWVATPNLKLHNDDISNVSSFPSYSPNLYDKTITWSVARNLSMSLAHDSGEGNIPLMPARNITVGEGAMDYLISR
ncbi:MAG: hypothetical protein QNK31_10215 [Porticoccus sp.]|nr:hypothetical protein [Porticoccus sp.]